jgi:hypothetical protein
MATGPPGIEAMKVAERRIGLDRLHQSALV